jgi:hypothetical protein
LFGEEVAIECIALAAKEHPLTAVATLGHVMQQIGDDGRWVLNTSVVFIF